MSTNHVSSRTAGGRESAHTKGNGPGVPFDLRIDFSGLCAYLRCIDGKDDEINVGLVNARISPKLRLPVHNPKLMIPTDAVVDKDEYSYQSTYPLHPPKDSSPPLIQVFVWDLMGWKVEIDGLADDGGLKVRRDDELSKWKDSKGHPKDCMDHSDKKHWDNMSWTPNIVNLVDKPILREKKDLYPGTEWTPGSLLSSWVALRTGELEFEGATEKLDEVPRYLFDYAPPPPKGKKVLHPMQMKEIVRYRGSSTGDSDVTIRLIDITGYERPIEITVKPTDHYPARCFVTNSPNQVMPTEPGATMDHFAVYYELLKNDIDPTDRPVPRLKLTDCNEDRTEASSACTGTDFPIP